MYCSASKKLGKTIPVNAIMNTKIKLVKSWSCNSFSIKKRPWKLKPPSAPTKLEFNELKVYFYFK